MGRKLTASILVNLEEQFTAVFFLSAIIGYDNSKEKSEEAS